MPVTISDKVLKQAGLTEREAVVEIACRLFDADKLSKTAAARLAGLSRGEFEDELIARNLPILHLDDEYLRIENGIALQTSRAGAIARASTTGRQ